MAAPDRQDARWKVTGRATYAAEHAVPAVAHAAVVTSTIARGRVVEIDDTSARGVPGVLGVLTPATMSPIARPSRTVPGGFAESHTPLEDDRVHHAGQALGVVIAETLEVARHARSLVHVRYAADPAAVVIADARERFEPSEFLGVYPAAYRRGDVAAGLAGAAATIDEVYETPIEHHNPMEPHATIAAWDGDRLTLYDTTQGVLGVRDAIAHAFALDPAHVRVISPYVGGGFGCKGFVWPRVILAAAAARVVGRPVKLVIDRQDMFTANGYRAATIQEVVLAATADGALRAIRHVIHTQTSANGEFFEPAGIVTPKLYAAPSVEMRHVVARLDLGSPTATRAPGHSVGAFALECAMDELSYRLSIDPVELRIRNHADADPEHGRPWSSKHLVECYRRGAERIGWPRRDPRPGQHHDGRVRVGLGMATAIYPANRDAAAATVRLLPDGSAEVLCATQDLGTGTYTVMSQIAAEVLGLPIERVTSRLGDTDLPPCPLSGGSRTVASIAPAVRAAAEDALRKRRSDPGAGAVEGHAELDPSREAADEPHTYTSFGAHFVEVHVDAGLGAVRVHRVVSVMDIGRALSAKTARSQIEGGVIWGIGMALMERSVIDRRTGRFVTRDLAEYLVPTHPDTPQIEVEFLDHPDLRFNPLGARGVGEIGIVGVAAAVANAVYHAIGVRVRRLPITPEALVATTM